LYVSGAKNSEGKPPVAIPIHKQFVGDLILKRWGNVDELEKGWAERVESGLQKTGRSRDRATIYRWLAQGLPNKRDEIFGFSAALGIDPVVLFDLESAAFQKMLRLEWIFFGANMEKRSRISAIWPMIRPSPHWPNLSICHDYYSRTWSVSEFSHPAHDLCNVYAQVRLRPEDSQDQINSHRAYYFAYRRKGARDGLWRPYGIVRKRGLEAICFGHNGDMMSLEDGEPSVVIVEECSSVDIETFFGPGPCEFKVACLDPFELRLIVPSRGTRCLRFSA
jgi:hypothetical protein